MSGVPDMGIAITGCSVRMQSRVVVKTASKDERSAVAEQSMTLQEGAVNLTEMSEVYREAIGTVGMAGLAGRGRTGLNRGAGSHESPAAAGKRAAADRLGE